MRYTLIIFDLDGTLLDTSAGALKSIDFTIDILGLAPLSNEVKKSFIGPPIYDSLKNTYGMDDILAAKATAIFRDVYKNNFLYEAEIYKGMESVLSSLKNRGYKLAVATYKREDYAVMLIERFNLRRYFDCVKGADNEGILKKQDIVEMCMAYCGAEKERSVLIGDTHHDAEAAQNIGIDFIGVTYGFGFKDYKDVNRYKNKGSADKSLDILMIL